MLADQDSVIDVAVEPRRIAAMQGWQWIINAFTMFKQAPTAWLGLCGAYILLVAGFSMLPFVGEIASTVLGPVCLGGVMWAAQKQANGTVPQIIDLFAGFQQRLIELVKVGAFLLIGVVIAQQIVALLGFSLPTKPVTTMAEFEPYMPALMLNLLAASTIYSVFIYAPSLVMLQGLAAGEAMKLSFLAFTRNWQPIFVMSLFGGALMLLAILPMFLGLIVALPVALLTSYMSYVDVFATENERE